MVLQCLLNWQRQFIHSVWSLWNQFDGSWTCLSDTTFKPARCREFGYSQTSFLVWNKGIKIIFINISVQLQLIFSLLKSPLSFNHFLLLEWGSYIWMKTMTEKPACCYLIYSRHYYLLFLASERESLIKSWRTFAATLYWLTSPTSKFEGFEGITSHLDPKILSTTEWKSQAWE